MGPVLESFAGHPLSEVVLFMHVLLSSLILLLFSTCTCTYMRFIVPLSYMFQFGQFHCI